MVEQMKLRYYILRRLLLMIPVLFGLSVLTFTMSHLLPGDPARLAAGPRATEEMVQVIVKEYGLDQPLHIQYITYVRNLIQGNWGKSMDSQRPVLDEIRRFFPATLELVFASMFMAFALGMPLGVIAARFKNRWPDQLASVFALSSVSFPRFWLALMLQLLLASSLSLLPVNGRYPTGLTPPAGLTGLYLVDSLLQGDFAAFGISLKHILMPAFVQSIGAMASITRMIRSDVLEVMSRDFVTMERSVGIPERIILGKYVLKNSFISTLTTIGLFFGFSLGGSVLVETVFDWPGIGLYAVKAAFYTDFQPIMGVTLVIGFSFMVVNLIVDLLYGVLDPRIRYG
jgi:peptide/nickel transport system permease protein